MRAFILLLTTAAVVSQPAIAGFERTVDGWIVEERLLDCAITGPGQLSFFPREGEVRIAIRPDRAQLAAIGGAPGQRVPLQFRAGATTIPVTYRRPGGNPLGGALGGALGGLSTMTASKIDVTASADIFAALAAQPAWSLSQIRTGAIVTEGKVSPAAMRAMTACGQGLRAPNRKLEPVGMTEQGWYEPNFLPLARVQDEAIPAGAVARLTVGPDGRVSDCTIEKSTGRREFDNAICNNMYGRARFRPATDGTGARIAASYQYKAPKILLTSPRWSDPMGPRMLREGCREGRVVGKQCFTLPSSGD